MGASGYPDAVEANRGPWQEGQLAWSRLQGWYLGAAFSRAGDVGELAETGDVAEGGESGDGLRALRALEDSGLIRRMLDQVEFEAVRAARRNGKSWAEIAVKLGVARQSAWERWKDVDETTIAILGSVTGADTGTGTGAQPGERELWREAGQGPDQGSETASLDEMVEAVARDLIERVQIPGRVEREWRRRSSVKVPNLVGMVVDVARKTLREKGLVAEGPDLDGPPLGALGWPDGVVIDQSPEAGAKVPPGSVVRLWVERGGGGPGGVREPRRPLPDPKSGQRMRIEVSDETVG